MDGWIIWNKMLSKSFNEMGYTDKQHKTPLCIATGTGSDTVSQREPTPSETTQWIRERKSDFIQWNMASQKFWHNLVLLMCNIITYNGVIICWSQCPMTSSHWAQHRHDMSYLWFGELRFAWSPSPLVALVNLLGILLERYIFLSATQNTGLNVASQAGAGSPPPALLHRG